MMHGRKKNIKIYCVVFICFETTVHFHSAKHISLIELIVRVYTYYI